jgi:hypothetical protein
VAQAECRSILRKAGLDLRWRRGSGGEEARPGEIRVVLVNHLVVDPRGPRTILGATPARRASNYPVVYIHLGSLRATLGIPPGFSLPDLPLLSRRNVGVALGRVVAHEIIHNLAPSLEHGDGVMSPLLRPPNLVHSHLALEPAMAEAVRDALGCGVVPAPAGRRLLASSAGATPPP